jgi:hypothetical protein
MGLLSLFQHQKSAMRNLVVKVSDANRMGCADMCSKLTGVGTLNSVIFFGTSSTGYSVYVRSE